MSYTATQFTVPAVAGAVAATIGAANSLYALVDSRRRELATLAHASRDTIVTVDRLHDGDLLADETLAAGVLPALYVTAIVLAPGGTRPLASATEPTDGAHIAEYVRLARTEAGFQTYLDRHVMALQPA